MCWLGDFEAELTPKLVSAFLLPGRTPMSFWHGYRAGIGITFSLLAGALFMSAGDPLQKIPKVTCVPQ